MEQIEMFGTSAHSFSDVSLYATVRRDGGPSWIGNLIKRLHLTNLPQLVQRIPRRDGAVRPAAGAQRFCGTAAPSHAGIRVSLPRWKTQASSAGPRPTLRKPAACRKRRSVWSTIFITSDRKARLSIWTFYFERCSRRSKAARKRAAANGHGEWLVNGWLGVLLRLHRPCLLSYRLRSCGEFRACSGTGGSQRSGRAGRHFRFVAVHKRDPATKAESLLALDYPGAPPRIL